MEDKTERGPSAPVRAQSSARLARNTIINLCGYALPLSAAILSVPPILNGLGTDKFGLLVLVWATVGYMSIFDLGISQSLTRNLAKAFAEGDEERIGALIGSSLLMLLLLSAAAGIATLSFAVFALDSILDIPQALHEDARQSFVLLAYIVPAMVFSAGLVGILEAEYRFDLSNAVSIPLGTFSFLGPLAAIQFSDTLVVVVAVLAIARFAALITLGTLVWRNTTAVHRLRFDWSTSKALARFGGWVTVSRIVAPLIVYFDRFAIATLLSLKALSYYAPSVEIASRLSVIPFAMARVLLPAIASQSGRNDPSTAGLFLTGARFTLFTMFPTALIAILYAEEGLTLWLGAEWAREGTRVLQLTMIGVFANSLSQPAVALLLGLGRPDLSAKLQLLQMPIFFASAWSIISVFGIVGAAAVSAARMVLDTTAHFWLAGQALGGLGSQAGRLLLVSLVACAVLFAAMFVTEFKLVALVFGFVGLCLAIWLAILSEDERSRLLVYGRRLL